MKVTVIVPSLNPDEKLLKVVEGVLTQGFTDIVVVNDGSDQAHSALFSMLSAIPGVTVLTHERNFGKGRALKTAFEYCLKNRPGIDGVVTVDGDNQHAPEDILACARRLAELGGCVVLGVRNFRQKNVPFKSFCGNTLTRLVFRAFCGIRITDTQTGLRAIPAGLLELMTRIEGERFEYETEMLLRLKKERVPIAEVPIRTVYISENTGSHFKLFRDSFLIYRMILRYILGAFTSFLIDYAVFAAIVWLIGADAPRILRLSCAYVPARLLSSVFNYMFNRSAVFHSGSPLLRTIKRYYLLWACQLLVSLGVEFLVSDLLGATPTGEIFVKLPVELILFFISFRIQQHWVFRD